MAIVNSLGTTSPIGKVGGSSVRLKTPSSYKYTLQDISKADAGRTESTKMDKEKIGQVVKVELEWTYLTTGELSNILTAFDPEYINIEYLDGKAGKFKTSEFYVGDRSAPMYNAGMGLWTSLSLNIIERSGL